MGKILYLTAIVIGIAFTSTFYGCATTITPITSDYPSLQKMTPQEALNIINSKRTYPGLTTNQDGYSINYTYWGRIIIKNPNSTFVGVGRVPVSERVRSTDIYEISIVKIAGDGYVVLNTNKIEKDGNELSGESCVNERNDMPNQWHESKGNCEVWLRCLENPPLWVSYPPQCKKIASAFYTLSPNAKK